MRKTAVLVLKCVIAALLCGAPQVVFAQNSTEQQQREKKDTKERKEEKKATDQKQMKTDGKAKKKSDPAGEVNRIYDSFKKSTEPVKKEAGSLQKSLNDAWDTLK